MESKLLKTGLAFCGTAAAIALISNGIDPTWWPIAPTLVSKPNISILYLSLAALGLLLVILHVATTLILRGRVAAADRKVRGFNCERASSVRDLAWIHTYAAQYFGTDVSSLDLMKSWHKKNRTLFWIVSAYRGSTRQQCGYFCVLPLNADAAKQIEAGTLDGTKIRSIDIAAKAQNASCIYIGGVAGANRKARARAMEEIRSAIDFVKFAKAQRAYARAATVDGLRLLRKYRFRPLNANRSGLGAMYFIDRDQ